MLFKLFFGILFIIQSILCYATAQEPDFIIYNGERYSLFSNPMEGYFNKFPEKRPSGWTYTANWRGYVATYELVQNELFVIGINVNGINIIKDCLDGLDRMKVNWATGLLVLPYGELVEYIHLGYASIYEHYKLIEIERGNFVGEYYLNGNQYEKYRTADIELWKKTEEYAEISKKYDFETEPTKEYEEILFELIEVSIPDEIVDYLIRKYDILKEMKSVFVQIVPEDIEKVPNNNKYYIFIICGMLGIIIGLYIIIKNINIRKTI